LKFVLIPLSFKLGPKGGIARGEGMGMPVRESLLEDLGYDLYGFIMLIEMLFSWTL
jgi:hypothetical protein